VQGRLRRQKLEIDIVSACGHCGHALRMTVDQDLGCTVLGAGAEPLLFEPSVDWAKFTGPDIIDVY